MNRRPRGHGIPDRHYFSLAKRVVNDAFTNLLAEFFFFPPSLTLNRNQFTMKQIGVLTLGLLAFLGMSASSHAGPKTQSSQGKKHHTGFYQGKGTEVLRVGGRGQSLLSKLRPHRSATRSFKGSNAWFLRGPSKNVEFDTSSFNITPLQKHRSSPELSLNNGAEVGRPVARQAIVSRRPPSDLGEPSYRVGNRESVGVDFSASKNAFEHILRAHVRKRPVIDNADFQSLARFDLNEDGVLEVNIETTGTFHFEERNESESSAERTRKAKAMWRNAWFTLRHGRFFTIRHQFTLRRQVDGHES